MDGLFNFATPETLQQDFMQNRVLNTQQMAQLPLLNQVAAMGGSAGSMLGNVVGRAFGGRSPEEARLEQMQGMLGGANMNDPDSLMEVAQRIQSVNPAAAQELAQRAMTMRKTQVETRAKEADILNKQREPINKLIQSGKYTPESVAAYQQSGDMADLKLLEGQIKFSTDAEEVARELYGKRFDALTPEETAAVNVLRNQRRVQEKQAGRTQVTVSPTLKQAGAVTGLVKDYDELTKQERETLQTVTQTKSLVNEAATANNSVAWESARTQLAKAVGEGRLSNEDIRRTGVDPRLVQGALDWVNKKTKGVPNQDIIQQLYAVATLLERASVDKINSTSKRTRAVAELEGIPQEQMDTLFPFMSTDRSPRRTNTSSTQTSRGTKYQIVED